MTARVRSRGVAHRYMHASAAVPSFSNPDKEEKEGGISEELLDVVGLHLSRFRFRWVTMNTSPLTTRRPPVVHPSSTRPPVVH